MNRYPISNVRVIDGDTIACRIDLGFYISLNAKIRLYGINAPEMRGSDRVAGLKSKEALKGFLKGQKVTIRTIKGKRTKKDRKGKYGRWLGSLFVDNNVISVNTIMVDRGFAEKKVY